ncbi:MAG: CoA transferase, partial [Proteobacteria bacterium]|nr:CoA transferase [Pseudomonadota bacterium]
VRNYLLLDEIVGAAIGRLTLAQLRETLTRHEVGFSPIYDIADVFDDPQFNARQAIVSVPDSELGLTAAQIAGLRARKVI